MTIIKADICMIPFIQHGDTNGYDIIAAERNKKKVWNKISQHLIFEKSEFQNSSSTLQLE